MKAAPSGFPDLESTLAISPQIRPVHSIRIASTRSARLIRPCFFLTCNPVSFFGGFPVKKTHGHQSQTFLNRTDRRRRSNVASHEQQQGRIRRETDPTQRRFHRYRANPSGTAFTVRKTAAARWLFSLSPAIIRSGSSYFPIVQFTPRVLVTPKARSPSKEKAQNRPCCVGTVLCYATHSSTVGFS